MEWTEFSHGTRDESTAELGRPGIGTPDGLNLADGTTDVDTVARVAADLTAAATLARSLPTRTRRARPRGWPDNSRTTGQAASPRRLADAADYGEIRRETRAA